MPWNKLDSSNLTACSYDAQARTLAVKFKSGNAYVYENVPAHVYEGLMNSDSPGTYFHQHVKHYGGNSYDEK